MSTVISGTQSTSKIIASINQHFNTEHTSSGPVAETKKISILRHVQNNCLETEKAENPRQKSSPTTRSYKKKLRFKLKCRNVAKTKLRSYYEEPDEAKNIYLIMCSLSASLKSYERIHYSLQYFIKY